MVERRISLSSAFHILVDLTKYDLLEVVVLYVRSSKALLLNFYRNLVRMLGLVSLQRVDSFQKYLHWGP